MKRLFSTYPIEDFEGMKIKMLNWSKQFNIFCLLDNHLYDNNSSFECILAVGSISSIESAAGKALCKLDEFVKSNSDWIFGHLSYDIKNEIEDLTSLHTDGTGFPDMFFFIPEVVVILQDKQLRIGLHDGDSLRIFDAINDCEKIIKPSERRQGLSLQHRLGKDEYLDKVEKIKAHILKGDCYELNFCQEFYSNNSFIDPACTYYNLGRSSPNPFSAFYKIDDKYLICASPERFLKKNGNKITSQPIKGTAPRHTTDSKIDTINKNELLNNAKEKAENVMVADLVRNDLSKICVEGSVVAEELNGIYSFPQVHQMISTISGILNTEKISEILTATFPMGSMTGVPKKKVMELIELYEVSRRGLYSGTLGYFDPEGDFDFNVVIRSILYNESEKYVSIDAGSAITAGSDPEKEYEECLLKISATSAVLKM